MTTEPDVRPVVIGFDRSPAAEHALREAGTLLHGRPAIVLIVVKSGLGFELVELPAATIGLPPSTIDIRTAMEIEQSLRDGAERLAQQGAALAEEAGFAAAEGLAVAEDLETPVSETIVRVARERAAAAIVVGAHGHSHMGEVILGSTSRDVIRHADRPVLVARKNDT
jgi:nucleotide-binding universal stress UspA family protein